jgi:diguanylate cyclase (GGDEF)-like protein/PAS domain S-box-containing protein
VAFAAPQASFASSAPSFLVHDVPLDKIYGDLQVGQGERNLTTALVLFAAIAGLVWVHLRRHGALRRSEERLDALLEHAHDVVVVLDAGGQATFVSSAVRGLLGYEPADLEGASLLQLIHPEDRDRAGGLVGGTLYGAPGAGTDVRLRDAGGGYRWFDIDATDLREHPEVAGVLLTCHEVGHRKALQEQLAHQARHDPLTGLPNRTTLASHLERLAGDVDPREFAVLFVDLDHFKPVNDQLGHDVGDEVLCIIADRLAGALRTDHEPPDLVCRLGGDEFAVVLVDATEATARAVADRLIRQTAAPVEVAGTTVRVGATIGIAVSHPNWEDPNNAVRRADMAMYHAKETERGTYALYDAHFVD